MSGTRGFFLIWFAQLVSIIGTALTGFVLGVWTYELTGSATQFALIMLSGAVPALIAAPIAGSIADRVHRRRILITADVVAAGAIFVLWLLVNSDSLQVWHVYPITAVTAVCGIVNQITFSAMVPNLVPKKHLSRANGLSQIVFAAQISAPIIAGVLLALIGLAGIAAVNLVTFGASLLIVAFVPLPAAAAVPKPGADKPGMVADIKAGWHELRRRPGLVSLLVVLGGYYFCFGIGGTLVRPLVLSFATPTELGFQVFAGGLGLLLGSIVMGIWGGPRKRMRGIALFMAIGGIALALHSLAPSIWLLCAVGPVFLFTLPVVNGTSQTVLQTKVDPAHLGKVMATARAVSQAASPLAYAAAGPLADHVFEPLLANQDSPLASSVGSVIGVGAGRGMAFMFLLVGILLVVLGGLAARQKLRRVEDLPDLLEEDKDDSVKAADQSEPVPVGGEDSR